MTEEEKDEINETKTIHEMEMESLKRELQELRDFKDKYFRLLAEQENARKRLQKDRNEVAQSATQNLILEMLQPIDHFERALKFSEQMSDEIKHWGQGFQMILSQLKDAISSEGVSPIEANPGDAFDPHFHEAVEMVETDEFPPGTIVQVAARGYKIGERTLRPARVTVAKEVKIKDEEEDNNRES